MAFSEKKFVCSRRKELLMLAVLVCSVWALLGEQVTGRRDKPAASRRTPAPLLGGGGGGAGHLPARFTRTIAHLGHAEMAIRVGGISDLEQLAQDSEKDHVRIMDVLTAYVRERAPRPAAAQTPPRDIQAILTVLGRWATTGKNRGTARLDLSNTHLVGAILLAADLFAADLSGANLSGANLSGAKNLTAAQVRSAEHWHEADLPASLNALLDPPA